MFRQVYEAATAIFLLQGVLIPVLLLVAGIAWYRQASRLTVMARAVDRDRRQRPGGTEALLESLPKLDPLHCDTCGSPLALEPGAARCIGCAARSDLPADYRATIALRRALARISAAAIRDWRIASILVSRPARFFFWFMILAMPALFVIASLGRGYRNTFAYSVINAFPNEVESALVALAYCGFIIWTITFWGLSRLAADLRKKAPPYPDVRRDELAAEYAACHACGGGIAFRSGAFAALCPYCTVATFRAADARRDRTRSEAQQVLTRASMFAARDIIADFVAMFVVMMALVSLGFAILIGAAAFSAWWF